MSTDQIHPNFKLLRNTGIETLHGCPRKFELDALSPPKEGDLEDEHLLFGDVVGKGIQEYTVTNDINKAYFTTFMAWTKILDDEDGDKAKKSFWHCIEAVNKFVLLRKTGLGNYELAYFNGKPAIELSIYIHLPDGFGYRMHIDIVLIDKLNKSLVVIESKTSGSYSIHPATFKNRGQALAYSIALDAIIPQLGLEQKSSYKVIYAVYKTKNYEWELLPFIKQHLQRAMWIKNILVDIDHIKGYARDNHFPMHGEFCLQYFKPCRYFEMCEMSNKFLIGDIVPRVEDMSEYQFEINLMDLINAQLAKHEATV